MGVGEARWTCERCKTGYLRLTEDKIVHGPAEYSEDAPGGYGEFVGIVLCTQKGCPGSARLAGDFHVEYGHDEEGEHEEITGYRVSFIDPAPHIIEIPSRCPREISSEVVSSFPLFWFDPRACANRLRVSIELILDRLNIKRSERDKKGTLQRLSLHGRIKLLKAREPILADLLLAAKWVGNDGSHAGAITYEQLFDVYEIVELGLEMAFKRSDKEIIKRADRINQRRKRRR